MFWECFKLFQCVYNKNKMYRYMPSRPDYFSSVQTEVRPHMRFMVTDWMLSVCTDTALAHSTNPEVFTLAVNFLDRFLSVCR